MLRNFLHAFISHAEQRNHANILLPLIPPFLRASIPIASFHDIPHILVAHILISKYSIGKFLSLFASKDTNFCRYRQIMLTYSLTFKLLRESVFQTPQRNDLHAIGSGVGHLATGKNDQHSPESIQALEQHRIQHSVLIIHKILYLLPPKLRSSRQATKSIPVFCGISFPFFAVIYSSKTLYSNL